MDKSFRIIFQGKIQYGRDLAQVRKQVALRLKISTEQVHKIFSGARITLKQGLNGEQALAYQRTLEQLGMLISVEEAFTPQATSPSASPPQSAASSFDRTHHNLARAETLLKATNSAIVAPQEPPETATPVRQKPTFLEGWLHESGFDRLERTQQRLADAEALLQRPALQASPSPAVSARQIAQSPSTPLQQNKRAQHSSHFICSHCGTPHEISTQLEINVLPSHAGQRESA